MPLFVKQRVMEALDEAVASLKKQVTKLETERKKTRAYHVEQLADLGNRLADAHGETATLKSIVREQKGRLEDARKQSANQSDELLRLETKVSNKDHERRKVEIENNRLAREVEARLSDCRGLELSLRQKEEEVEGVTKSLERQVAEHRQTLSNAVEGQQAERTLLRNEIRSLRGAAVVAPLSDINYGPHGA